MTEQTSPARDPFAMWREWLSQSERQWNAFFNDVMGTEQFSQYQGRFTELYLAMQRNMSEAMGRYLTTLDMPTRSDVLGLGQRLSLVEDRLRTIEEGLTRLSRGATADEPPTAAPPQTAVAAPRPARTRKPGMP